MTQQKNSYFVPLAFVGALFFMIGFALGINGLLIPYLKKAFDLTSAQSYLVLTATFAAFVLFGYPSGLIIKKIGYKKSMILSFLFFTIGLLLFIPSAMYESLPLFLVASFISGMGNTLLQAAVNPYVTIIGPIESAAARMSVMGILNKAAWAIAPIFLGFFLKLGENVQLQQIYLPFAIIAGIFVLLGIITFFAPLPEVKAEGEDEEVSSNNNSTTNKTSVFQFPHLLLGMLALLLYVGVETLAMASIVDYAEAINVKSIYGAGFLSNPANYTTFTVICMVIGYICGILFIPKKISQSSALRVCAIIGIISSLLIVLVPTSMSIWFVALLGLANSLMWGAIWPLAISHLGRFTKEGSSLLVMAIVGGAIIPLLFGFMVDSLGHQLSYTILCMPVYVFILYYALAGHKQGLKNVK